MVSVTDHPVQVGLTKFLRTVTGDLVGFDICVGASTGVAVVVVANPGLRISQSHTDAHVIADRGINAACNTVAVATVAGKTVIRFLRAVVAEALDPELTARGGAG